MSVNIPREPRVPSSPSNAVPGATGAARPSGNPRPLSPSLRRATPEPRSAEASRSTDGTGEDRTDRTPFARLLGGLGREMSKGEASVRSAIESTRGGADLSPSELLALQVGVYRYSETVDLASKLIDRVTGAVKTVVQGQ